MASGVCSLRHRPSAPWPFVLVSPGTPHPHGTGGPGAHGGGFPGRIHPKAKDWLRPVIPPYGQGVPACVLPPLLSQHERPREGVGGGGQSTLQNDKQTPPPCTSAPPPPPPRCGTQMGMHDRYQSAQKQKCKANVKEESSSVTCHRRLSLQSTRRHREQNRSPHRKSHERSIRSTESSTQCRHTPRQKQSQRLGSSPPPPPPDTHQHNVRVSRGSPHRPPSKAFGRRARRGRGPSAGSRTPRREENCSAVGRGGDTEAHPPPPASLATVTGGGVQGGGARPAVPGGGGQPNIYGSKLYPRRADHCDYSNVGGGGDYWWKKSFRAKNLCFCAFGANIRSWTKQRARHGTPFLHPTTLLRRASMSPPPPPRRAIFRSPNAHTRRHPDAHGVTLCRTTGPDPQACPAPWPCAGAPRTHGAHSITRRHVW